VHYSISLSNESDHLLRQLCDPGKICVTEAISPEEFLSAFVEDQLGELFTHRERAKTARKKNGQNAVLLAREQTKAWREANAATHTCCQSTGETGWRNDGESKDRTFAKIKKTFFKLFPLNGVKLTVSLTKSKSKHLTFFDI
jgi:hypothetical protein